MKSLSNSEGAMKFYILEPSRTSRAQVYLLRLLLILHTPLPTPPKQHPTQPQER
jgi:hypothetical protein